MIRVIIERHLKEGKREELAPLLMKLRTEAMQHPGYVTGETLVSTEDDSLITVLSTWRSLDDWKAWEKSEPRVKLYWQIDSLLQEKPKVSTRQIMATEEKAG